MQYNQLVCGDAIEEMSKLPSNSVDLIIADPPYNLGKDYGNNQDTKEWGEYEAFTKKWLVEAQRLLKDLGSIYVFMGVRFIAKLFLTLESELGFNSIAG